MNVFLLCFLGIIRFCTVKGSSLITNVAFSKNPLVNRVDDLTDLKGEDAVLSFRGLVERYGYTTEEHRVTTEDGYHLILHRITESPSFNSTKKKSIVYLQHGMIGSSDAWVLIGPKQDLAFLLADDGYDVWAGNFRGNTYCRSHVNLTTNDRDFWQFSFHEIAQRDISAMVDYILNVTDTKHINYIGHSMGTTVAYILLSTKPEYNEKIKFLINFAPVAYWKHAPTLFVAKIIWALPLLQNMFDLFEIYDLAPQSSQLTRTARYFCSDSSIFQPICIEITSLLSGLRMDTLNTTWLPHILSHYPAGVSVKTIVHYLQNMRSGNFEAFDYGDMTNYYRYKQLTPPQYDISKISVPVALFYGSEDKIVNHENVNEILGRLPKVIAYEKVQNFTHMAFLFDMNARDLLYAKVLILLNELEHPAVGFG